MYIEILLTWRYYHGYYHVYIISTLLPLDVVPLLLLNQNLLPHSFFVLCLFLPVVVVVVTLAGNLVVIVLVGVFELLSGVCRFLEVVAVLSILVVVMGGGVTGLIFVVFNVVKKGLS